MSSRRNTVQKQLVLDTVRTLDIHATAEQVYDHVAKVYPSISRATVYRNLHQLVDTGDLANVGTFYGSTHYDHRLHEHSHFICSNCMQVFDVDGDFSDIMQRAAKTNGVMIDSYQLSFSGVCGGCQCN